MTAIRLLFRIPIQSFINVIDHPYDFKSKDIYQFSCLEDATERICDILEFECPLLSFEEVGQRLVHASKQPANIKYGENHAKTAAMLSLVVIKRIGERQCNMVSITSLGSITTTLPKNNKEEVIRRLAIRNPFIKTLIFRAKTNAVSYKEEVSKALSGQTIIRRKHNNEVLVNMILSDDPLRNRIRWK